MGAGYGKRYVFCCWLNVILLGAQDIYWCELGRPKFQCIFWCMSYYPQASQEWVWGGGTQTVQGERLGSAGRPLEEDYGGKWEGTSWILGQRQEALRSESGGLGPVPGRQAQSTDEKTRVQKDTHLVGGGTQTKIQVILFQIFDYTINGRFEKITGKISSGSKVQYYERSLWYFLEREREGGRVGGSEGRKGRERTYLIHST